MDSKAIGRYAITTDITRATAIKISVRRDFRTRFTSKQNKRILFFLPFDIFLWKQP